MPTAEAEAFFASLHFYYDFGCFGCKDPGAILRYLYTDLLPCTDVLMRNIPRHLRTHTRNCLAAAHNFSPSWVDEIARTGWAEVEHRAIGFLVRKESEVPGLSGAGVPNKATAFMDPGAAGMWYTFRRGSGIFYRMGRAKFASGKTSMMAALLADLARTPGPGQAAWSRISSRIGLFTPEAPSISPSADADRVLAVANGSSKCNSLGINFCRCQSILHDIWDDAMVWLARILKYDTLFFTATLLCHQDAHAFTTAYPELADVRPLELSWIDEQERGSHTMLVDPPGPKDEGDDKHNIYTRRKQPHIAEAWINRIKEDNTLMLRDPFAVTEDRYASPCNFSVAKWSLQCEGHISAHWAESEWHSCSLPMCGAKGLWVGGLRATESSHDGSAVIPSADSGGVAQPRRRSEQPSLTGALGRSASPVQPATGTSAAICMSGLLRTLLAKPVVSTFQQHVLRPMKASFTPVDTYITVVNTSFPAPTPLRKDIDRAYASAIVELFPEQGLPTFKCGVHGSHLAGSNGSVTYTGTEKRALRHARYILLQWVGIRACYEQIVMGEETRGEQYSMIFRTRTDIVYLQDFPISPAALQQRHVFVPLGGMSDKDAFKCMNDHMFICPRALCRPYFHLLELWESQHCVEQTEGGSVEPRGTTKSIFATPTVLGLQPRHTLVPPTSNFALPVPPSDANAEWYFFARYSRDGRLCGSGEAAEQCCGLLREVKWQYAIARGSKESGYIECKQRLVRFWRGDQVQLAKEHQASLKTCETLGHDWGQAQATVGLAHPVVGVG